MPEFVLFIYELESVITTMSIHVDRGVILLLHVFRKIDLIWKLSNHVNILYLKLDCHSIDE